MKKLLTTLILIFSVNNVWADTDYWADVMPTTLTAQQALTILTDESQISPTARYLLRISVLNKKNKMADQKSNRTYWLISAPLSFFKFNVLAYQTSLPDQKVECCVPPSNSFIMIPSNGTDLEGLRDFARTNQCTVQSEKVMDDMPEKVALKLIGKYKTKNFFELTCDHP